MKKLYLSDDKIIVTVQNSVSSVKFYKLNMNGYLDSYFLNPETLPFNKFNVRVVFNIDEQILRVYYRDGLTAHEICNLVPKYFSTDLSMEKDCILQINDSIIPEKSITINGIEYLKTDKEKYFGFSVYLYHFNKDKGITENKNILYKENLHIFLIDSICGKWTCSEYLDYINEIPYIHAVKINEKDFQITNIYNKLFDGTCTKYLDNHVTNPVDELYVNDVVVIADFIRQMRELYPEIQFYARVEDRDTTKYGEWINYKFTSGAINSQIFTSHVWYNQTYGRHWTTGVTFEFEYFTADLPTCIARKDSFLLGTFLNKNDKFVYKIKDENYEDCIAQYCVFWNRDIDTNYQSSASQDETQSSMFSYKFNGTLTFVNLEKYPIFHDKVESVVYRLVYLYTDKENKNHAVSFDEETNKLLLDNDLDGKSMIASDTKNYLPFENIQTPFEMSDMAKDEPINTEITDKYDEKTGVLTKEYKLKNKISKYETHSKDDIGVLL